MLLRWLLDPVTSLLAVRLRAQNNGPMSYEAAWRLARVTRHPDEMGYRLHGHLPEDPTEVTGPL
ncbi:hypothetical protein [Streptomyces turgidiscabies]|uniref:Transposase n=1 Tax=Streptomyces turgidiscabies TaxID=85558 RepID=A0ABU0RFL0_9ACTN|nr:hypothetical protein [Streptomyces turgidiscabies]MDQ0930787.1 hypothetical protein [Streptomyces turgidiscabies]